MGNYENIVKTEEIRKHVEAGDYLSAQKVLDTMDCRKIKNLSDLNLLAEVYKENEKYEEAAQLYLRVYEKLKTRKTISQLVNIYIKKGNAEKAQEYLSQYQKVSPEDFDGQVFRYKLEKLKGASYEQLIDILLALKKIDYTEKWTYELAKLYYKAGLEEACVKECSDIILWFGEGTYVEKARMLRSYYSGETGREKIMEELKRRSEQGSREKEGTLSEEKDQPEQQTEDRTDREDELEVGLSRDIQNMMDKGEEIEQEEQVILEDSPEAVSEALEEYGEEDQAWPEEYPGEDQGEENGPEAEASLEPVPEEEAAPEDNTYIANSENQSEEEMPDEDEINLKDISEKYQLNIREIFDNFLPVPSVKKQLVKGLEILLKENGKAAFVIITGAKGTGKTTLAKGMALLFSKAGKIGSSKVAKISAEKLNTVDIESKRETLKSCCLVVENASELKRTTIEKILELTKQLQGDIAVIFEEDKKNMNKLFRECPRLMDLLKVRIHLPQYNAEDLLGFATACLRQKDYQLNPKAEAVLKSRLNQLVKQELPDTWLARMNELLQAAMDATDLRTGKQLSDLASRGRLKEGLILEVLPEDLKN